MKLPLLREKALGKQEFRLREPQRDKQNRDLKRPIIKYEAGEAETDWIWENTFKLNKW